jgi:hypothetical protein
MTHHLTPPRHENPKEVLPMNRSPEDPIPTTPPTEIVPRDPTPPLAVLQHDTKELCELIQEVIGGALRLADLPKIKVVGGRSTDFQLADGTQVRRVVGTIVHVQRTRALFTGQRGELPLCRSDDGVLGVGSPGGPCRTCPCAQFQNGGRPECSEYWNLVMFGCDDHLPSVLQVPSTSFTSLQQYRFGLVNRGQRACDVITTVTLVTKAARGGFEYPEFQFAVSGTLTDAQRARMRAHAAALKDGLTAPPESRQAVVTVEPEAVTADPVEDAIPGQIVLPDDVGEKPSTTVPDDDVPY